MNSYTLYHLK